MLSALRDFQKHNAHCYGHIMIGDVYCEPGADARATRMANCVEEVGSWGRPEMTVGSEALGEYIRTM